MGRVYGSQLGHHFDRMEPIRQQPPFKHGPHFFKQEVRIFLKHKVRILVQALLRNKQKL